MTSSVSQRLETNPSPQSNSIMSLPDDLLFNCIARVPRLHYPTLALASKSFRSLLASPEFYKTRSLLGKTERCLYVCIEYGSDDYRWFTLHQKTDQTITKYVLTQVPIPYSPNASFSSLVAVGCNIYNIGGSNPHSSRVSILNCQSHTWREAPSFPVNLRELSASVVDQKIYVAGNCIERYSSSFHVLDTNVQVWNAKPVSNLYNFKTASIDGKCHIVINNGDDVIAYNSKEDRWEGVVGPGMGDFMFLNCYCVIDNILYSAFQGAFRWYDTIGGKWRMLKGLVGLPKFDYYISATLRLADYGGKMAVFWVENFSHGGFWRVGANSLQKEKQEIWCMEIALERRESGEIWGEVEWFDQVLTDPSSFCKVVKALGVTC